MSKFKKTYYTKNIESRETKRDETEKIFTKLEKQTNCNNHYLMFYRYLSYVCHNLDMY